MRTFALNLLQRWKGGRKNGMYANASDRRAYNEAVELGFMVNGNISGVWFQIIVYCGLHRAIFCSEKNNDQLEFSHIFVTSFYYDCPLGLGV